MSATTEPARKGRPVYRTELDLPIPPSANRLWRSGQGNTYRSAEYMNWIESAGWELKAQKPISIPAPIGIKILAGIPDRPRDLDNIGKALLDLLEAHEVIPDDKSVVSIVLKWDRIIPTGRVRIEAWHSSPPHRRITAETRAKITASTKAFFGKASAP